MFLSGCYHFSVTTAPNFCPSCGSGLEGTPSFCPSCGARVSEIAQANINSTGQVGLWSRYWKRSVKAKIFYGLWVFLNFSNVVALFSAASAPVDRFRSVCGWEGVSCGPSSEEKVGQALLNLIIWNLAFWTFRYFYKKRQSK